jgi:NIPSNAP
MYPAAADQARPDQLPHGAAVDKADPTAPALTVELRNRLVLCYEGETRLRKVPRSSRPCSDGKPRGDDSMAFYELRQYFVRPGKMDEWVKIMEEEIIPFQVSKGMVICGSFRGETDNSAYIWIRRFNSEAEREAQYKAVYETDHWKTKIAPRVPDCLDREKMHIQRIVPTSRSTMQ